MQAFEISSKARGAFATVWAESAEHACHIVWRVLKLARPNAWLSTRQINGRGPRFDIARQLSEAVYARNYKPAPPAPPEAGPARNVRIEPITCRLLLDGQDTGLHASQRRPGGPVTVYEPYMTQSWGCDFTGQPTEAQVLFYDLPRKCYTLDSWPPKPRTGSYVDFERDVRALLKDLEQQP